MVVKGRGWLALLALLAACGGGTVAVLDSVQAPADPAPAPAPAVQPPAASAPSAPAPVVSAPEIVATQWAVSGPVVLREDWAAPKLGGWIAQDQRPCAGGVDDPGSGPVSRFGLDPDGWSIFNPDVGRGAFAPAPGGLAIDSLQQSTGFALLSGLDLDPARPIKLTGVIDVQPDEGAMLSLALHNGEGNYRSAGLAWSGGQLHLLAIAPCYPLVVGQVEPGARLLAIEYHPAHGWRISVDGRERYAEPIDYRNNRLRGQPRAGWWAVNHLAEARKGPGRVRGLLGPVTVQQGPL